MGILCQSLEEYTAVHNFTRSHSHRQIRNMDFLKSLSLVKADGTKKPGSEIFAGKDFICIYFSAHWCPPCRGFTPVLKDFYEEVDGVEIVFVSSDQTAEAMVAYMKESHGDWWAVEFGSDAVKTLKSHFGVSGIPMLAVINKEGKLVTKDGRGDVSGKGPASIAEWKKA